MFSKLHCILGKLWPPLSCTLANGHFSCRTPLGINVSKLIQNLDPKQPPLKKQRLDSVVLDDERRGKDDDLQELMI